jgi:hypothetical protein
VTQEETRLQEAREGVSNWKKWGPYLSERQWGTVREDYSKEAMRGIISLMIMHVRARIAGGKTESQAFPRKGMRE